MKTVVVGGGAAGIAASIAAAKNGSETLLLDSESTIGGDLFSGIPILGAYTSLGEACVGGIIDEIIDTCKEIDPAGYIGPVCDWRTVHGLCLDPEILYPAVMQLLAQYGVRLLLNTSVVGVESRNGVVSTLQIAGRDGISSIVCNCVVDASGGGNITRMTGGEVVAGDREGRFQPVSLTFRMADVEFEPLLRFIRDNPEEALLCENPVLPKDPSTAAGKLYGAGLPYVAISANGTILGEAIRKGSVHQCTAAFITPTSVRRQEVCINSTRVSGIDCTDDTVVSGALFELSEQIVNLSRFLRQRVPGFEKSSISSIAHRVGVRETGRIRGEYTLTQNDVINAVRHEDCVARGCHHVDIHGEGTSQVRIPVREGRSYDIPYRCLIPIELKNVIAAGRCLSSDRGANGSARVMGTCLATGQAAGLAAALYVRGGHADFRNIDTTKIRWERRV